MGNLVFQATLGGQVNLVGPNTASTFNLNVPAVSSTIATLTGTETFTNKTLTSPTLTTPVLGTPSSGTLTNCTGLPNAGLTNSSVTVGSTSIALGATATTIAGLTSLATNTLTSASATALTLQSAGTTAITVDTSQNVGIGSTSPASKLEVKSASPVVTINQTDTSTTCRLAFYGYNRNYETTAINTTEGGTAGAGNLTFWTNSGGSGNSTERMRITSAGEVLVNGTAAPVNGLKMAITNGSVKWSFGPDGSGNYCVFNASGTGVYVTNGGTSWTGTSDERLKTDLIPITNGLQKVNSLRSVTGRFKTDEEGTSRAFLIAQDVQAVFPEAVNTLNDEIGTLGLAYTDVIPLLVSAIKELKAINDTQAETLTQQTEAINALTARIVALEAK